MDPDELLRLMDERDRRYAERFNAQEVAVEKAFAALERAQELAYTELQRRLDVLNHAHQEAQRVQDTYLPREVWENSKVAIQRTTFAVLALAVAVAGLLVGLR